MRRRHWLIAWIFLLVTADGSWARAQEVSADQERQSAFRMRSATVPSFAELPVARILVDASSCQGPLETWRHGLGQGGISPTPLPERIVQGARKLQPRLIRIFIQEFFRIYPEHGEFDWSRLDPYMEALSKTGAKVVAAITIKPEPLFPAIDQSIWRPNDVAEWQRVVAALVRRYSVERPIVTHWEIGNEPDIGEDGGCPYLITEPDDYAEYYNMTIQPILATFPEAKVGGPAVANPAGHLPTGFIDRCVADKTRLDFVSWHVYADDPAVHAMHVARYRTLLAQKFPEGRRPEMMVTEWSKGFEPVSVEEAAFHPRRAAATAASIVAMTEAGVDWSFYYHLWDQTWRVEDFKPFYKRLELMSFHWNQMPHRFGMFGVAEEVRPQYFVYQMLGRLGAERLRATSDAKDVRILAARDERAERVALMLVNYGLPVSQDYVATIEFSGLKSGPKRLSTSRIDRSSNWSAERLELLPAENREVETGREFSCQVYCPADSVGLVSLAAVNE
jgi:xylan 1,4-beta-xylosidase